MPIGVRSTRCAPSCPGCGRTRRRSSGRCPPWRTASARSTSARASPTPTALTSSSASPSASIEDGSGNQYPPAHGHPDLRAAIAEHQDRWYRLRYDPATEVVVGTGASEVIVAALLALVGPGDEVLLLEPAFDIYAAGVALAGATAVPVPLGPGFRPDPARDRGGGHGPDPADPGQQPPQPHGDGPDHRRPRRRRRRRQGPRPRGAQRRGVRAPRVRRGAPRPHGDETRHARADSHGGQRRQVVLVHRLEGGMGDRTRASGGRRPGGAPAPVVRLGRPVPACRGRRAAAPRRLLPAGSPPTSPHDGTGSRRGWPRSDSRRCGPRAPTSP